MNYDSENENDRRLMLKKKVIERVKQWVNQHMRTVIQKLDMNVIKVRSLQQV